MNRTLSLLFVTLAMISLESPLSRAQKFIVTSSGSSGSAGSRRPPTFNRDVAPILFRSCAECHRPGEVAPMSLLTYKEARPWAKSIREKVIKREMPPWHADPHAGEFANDRRLSQSEIDTIVEWADGAALEGDSRDLPSVPKFTDGWSIDKPDLVLPIPQEFTLEAQGPDEYQYFVIDPGFTEDKFVQMVEARPGNRKIVHHINIFIQPPPAGGTTQKELTREQLERMRFEQEKDSILYRDGLLQRLKPDVGVFDDGCELASGGAGTRPDGSGERLWPTWLGGYVPGANGMRWKPGFAKKVPAGSRIVLNVHYSRTTGKVEKDRSVVGLVFAKQETQKQVLTRLIANHYFRIPPGAADHVVTACWTANEDIHLISAVPHMHYRGKAMEVRAVYPDNRFEVLLNVPEYKFAWQTMYYFKMPVAISKGTRIVLTGHFDNSTGNRYNPDPSRAVRWGDPTYDEMMMGILEYTVDKP